jgi:hypothetical protein
MQMYDEISWPINYLVLYIDADFLPGVIAMHALGV